MSNSASLVALKVSVIAIGTICFLWAASTFPLTSIDTGFVGLLVFAILMSPRLSLTLPRSQFMVSFSDALIFLSLLLYGGSSAIILATFEMLANCLYLQSQGKRFGHLMIKTNVAINVIATTVTVVVWSFLLSTGIEPGKTHHLISILGLLAITQFVVSSTIAAILQSRTDKANVWETWKQGCFSSSMSQIIGVGIAGIFFKIINYGDIIAGLVAFVTFVMLYLYFYQSVNEMKQAIDKVEGAERERAETERTRRKEAEAHAKELTKLLAKEERSNTALRQSEKDLQHAALYDSLTGLANRKNLNRTLEDLIANYRKDPTASFQVLFLDIRKFKNINDTLGHTVGDKVLSIAAKRFQRFVDAKDTVARMGGDEFAIVLKNVSTSGKAYKIAKRIYDSIGQPFSLAGHKIVIELNIGIASCDTEYRYPEEILRDADIAMHHAKERNEGLAIFTTEIRSRFQERVRFEMDLSNAIERGELSLNYQPIVDLSTGGLAGFEALCRWNHPEHGPVPPSKFIPIAEQSRLIQPMTVWILRESCNQLMEWRTIAPEYSDLMISVNISGKHLNNNDLIDDVENALAETGLPPSLLKLEITESSAMENPEHTANVLNRLKHLGVKLSIDDFGTGYSSLSYLQKLPFDSLKIDRSFVKNVGTRAENSEILQTIVSLAKNLRLRSIAEGIETEAQLSVLRNLGCDLGQGYLLARPKGREETERLLYSRHHQWFPQSISGEFEKYDISRDREDIPVF